MDSTFIIFCLGITWTGWFIFNINAQMVRRVYV